MPTLRPIYSTAQLHGLSDDDVDYLYACNHSFVSLRNAENYSVCVYCRKIMWMVIELVDCDWRGRELVGHV